jgi:hypothetical protein
VIAEPVSRTHRQAVLSSVSEALSANSQPQDGPTEFWWARFFPNLWQGQRRSWLLGAVSALSVALVTWTVGRFWSDPLRSSRPGSIDQDLLQPFSLELMAVSRDTSLSPGESLQLLEELELLDDLEVLEQWQQET